MDQAYIKHHTENIPITGTPGPKTPSRKKPSARTPRKGRQEDIPWTAARCHRLLRTIASRIHILRRLSENDFAEQALRTPKAKRKREVSVDPVVKLGSQFATLETPSRGDDPEWFPATEKKILPRTYGGRGRPRKHEGVASGGTDVGFRTPYIRKIMRAEATLSPVSPACDAYSTSSRIVQMERKGRQDSIQPKTHAERALKTLLDSFDSLLACTNPKAPTSRRGASSLLSMCLRKVPAYIDFEQNWAEEVEDDYAFDAIETIYVELENIGSGSWHGLREVVRGHAVKMIADAMEERMWPLKSLDALMDICTKHRAVVECQQLLRVWLVSSRGKIERPVENFVEYAVKFDYKGFMFRTLADLLASDIVQCSEVSTIAVLWEELPMALARRSFQASAAEFLGRYAVCCSARKSGSMPDTSEVGTQTTDIVRSLLPLITLMCLLWEYRGTSHENLADQIHRLTLHVASELQSSIQSGESDTQSALQMADLFLTSSLMICTITGQNHVERAPLRPHDLTCLILQNDLRASQLRSTASATLHRDRTSHVLKIMKLVESVDKKAAHEAFRKFAYGLLEASQQASRDAATSMTRLAVEMTSAWAEHRMDNDSFAFAEDIQQLAARASLDSGENQFSDFSDEMKGYRWEEGIAEWVAATPFEPKVVQDDEVDEPSVLSQDSGIGMSENDTPSKKPGVVADPMTDELSRCQQWSPTVQTTDHLAVASESAVIPPAQTDVPATSSPLSSRAHEPTTDRSIDPLNAFSVDKGFSDDINTAAQLLAVPIDTPCAPRTRAKPPRGRVARPRKQTVPDDRDELGMSPCKATSPPPDQCLDTDVSGQRDSSLSSSVEARRSAVAEANRTPGGQVGQDRDELAMTPYGARNSQRTTLDLAKKVGPSRVVARKPRLQAVVATPARMTLRSQRREMSRDGSAGGVGSDDELGS